MNINTLPDDCLRLIMQNISLHQLIHLRSVCHRWFNQIELVFMESKKSLKLFASGDEVYQFREVFYNYDGVDHVDFSLSGRVDDILVIGPERVHQASVMVPLIFPNIEKLLIRCAPLFECDGLVAMLPQWPHLISLVISARMQHIAPQVLAAINSLTSLKRLHLMELFQSKIPAQLPVLSKLEHFSLVHYMSDCVPVLAQLGPACVELCLCWIHFSRDELTRLLQANVHLAQYMKHLTLAFIATNHENRLRSFYRLFQLICERFQALEHLDIVFADHLPLSLLIPQLVKLPNLAHLDLYISSNELGKSDQLPPLLTIRTLNLEIHNISIDIFVHKIAPIFPNVQNLIIKCDYEEQEEQEEFRRKCFNVEVFPELIKFRLKF